MIPARYAIHRSRVITPGRSTSIRVRPSMNPVSTAEPISAYPEVPQDLAGHAAIGVLFHAGGTGARMGGAQAAVRGSQIDQHATAPGDDAPGTVEPSPARAA